MDRTPAGAPNFLRHVADLAEKREVVAGSAIHSTSGVKLADCGERITAAHYDELAKHKLQTSLEESLIVSDVVTSALLRQAVADLLDDEPVFSALVADDVKPRLLHHFATLPLAPPLAFKLTVARDERPEVFAHSIKVAYCAAALAQGCGLAQHAVVDAAAAGLFHDLGLLHVDPELLKGRRALTDHERNYLYAHPLTSYLILEHDPIWHPVVSTAVLEHHERIDGSGYPKGLRREKLGQLGQLLAVAEMAATLLSYGGGCASRERLEVVLAINEGKLNHEYARRLLDIFPPSPPSGMPPPPLGRALEILVDLSVVFLRWQATATRLPDSLLAGFINRRVASLAHNIARVGIDLDYWSTFNTDIDFDAKTLAEMEAAAHECVWQMHAIADEVRRRWDQLVVGSEPFAAIVEKWLASVDTLKRG